ncbi:MAG: glycosyltransferase family 2 protein [Leptospirales bacterium]|nr:glycosyltransferase family 2 protein [Leptospirales bacterium]
MLLAIPVFNEKKTIQSLLEQTVARLPQAIKQILCIDDGSTDGSGALLDQIAKTLQQVRVIHQVENGGYGKSIRTGLEIARAENFSHLITMDCDLQHRPEDLIRFVSEPADIDVVSGSRYMPESTASGHAPLDRMEINARITQSLNRRYGWNLTDAFCGFKRFRMVNIEPAQLVDAGYAFPMEFWAYARMKPLTIKEIPVSRIYTTDDRSFGEDLDRKRRRYRYYLQTWRNAERRFQVRASS